MGCKMSDTKFQRKVKPVVLVTGCGSGVGFRLAKILYQQQDKYNVVITCRSHRLEILKQGFEESAHFKICELDILNESNIYQLVHNICSDWGRIDVVVNNAAVCYRGVVEHMDSDSEMLQLKTNYLGPMSLIRSILPIMREQRSGQIINVSSVSGMVAMPTMGSYSASKHALEGASEALWYEARPFGIKINLVELGFIKSESFRNVILSNKARISSLIQGPHSEYYTSMTPFIEKLMNFSITTSEDVAKKIVTIIKNKPDNLRITATPDVWLFSFLKRIFPLSWQNKIYYWMLPGSIKWGGHWKKENKIYFANHKLNHDTVLKRTSSI